ncbi:MAG: hypothetical protein ACI802_002089 [Candidatus Paceibacteria bacterium]|jgi:hypothetical protein
MIQQGRRYFLSSLINRDDGSWYRRLVRISASRQTQLATRLNQHPTAGISSYSCRINESQTVQSDELSTTSMLIAAKNEAKQIEGFRISAPRFRHLCTAYRPKEDTALCLWENCELRHHFDAADERFSGSQDGAHLATRVCQSGSRKMMPSPASLFPETAPYCIPC